MRDRVPAIRCKATGNHFVRWGGRDWSLGTDPDKARWHWIDPRSTHPGRMSQWQAWRASGGGDLPLPTLIDQPTRPDACLVAHAARDMLAQYERLGHHQSARSLRSSLKVFLSQHGGASIVELATVGPGIYRAPVLILLESMRDDLITPDEHGLAYAPRTINHALAAVALLFKHAHQRGWCPEVSFKSLEKLTPPAASPEDLSPAGVAWLVRIAAHADPSLAPVLAAQYLTLCRSSEVIVLLAAWAGDAGAGTVMDRSPWGHRVGKRGLVELLRHKNSHRGESYRRLVIVTDEAAEHLDRAVAMVSRGRPGAGVVPGSRRWSRADGYEHAVLRAIGVGPRVLRDSGASNLRLLGVDLADVDLALGHQPRGAIASYARAPWPALRETVARLSLRSAP